MSVVCIIHTHNIRLLIVIELCYYRTERVIVPRGANRRQTDVLVFTGVAAAAAAAAWIFAWVDPVTHHGGRLPATPGHRHRHGLHARRRREIGRRGLCVGHGRVEGGTQNGLRCRGGRTGSRARPRVDDEASEPDHWVTRERGAGLRRPGRFRDGARASFVVPAIDPFARAQ